MFFLPFCSFQFFGSLGLLLVDRSYSHLYLTLFCNSFYFVPYRFSLSPSFSFLLELFFLCFSRIFMFHLSRPVSRFLLSFLLFFFFLYYYFSSVFSSFIIYSTLCHHYFFFSFLIMFSLLLSVVRCSFLSLFLIIFSILFSLFLPILFYYFLYLVFFFVHIFSIYPYSPFFLVTYISSSRSSILITLLYKLVLFSFSYRFNQFTVYILYLIFSELLVSSYTISDCYSLSV